MIGIPEIGIEVEKENECTKWLESRAISFEHQLSIMGKRFNYEGARKPNESYLDEHGVHTGIGMCEIASAAIEESARKKYGERVKTSIVTLNTPKSLFAHAVTRIVLDAGQSITVDGSHRQIDKSAPGLIVLPTEKEGEIFQTRYVQAQSFDGTKSSKIRDDIKRGKWRNTATEDYDKLVSTLTEE